MIINLVLTADDSAEAGWLTPLTPGDLGTLANHFPLKIRVETSPNRCFADDEYAVFASQQGRDSAGENWVLGIHSVQPEKITADSWYFLSSPNGPGGPDDATPMLERMMRLGCTLIDLDKLDSRKSDSAFSWAHMIGMLGAAQSLYILGQKMKLGGLHSALAELKPVFAYGSLGGMLGHLDAIGNRISEDGLPDQICPLVISILAGGAFQSGIDAVLEQFPLKTFSAHVVDENLETFSGDVFSLYRVLFREDEVSTLQGERFLPFSPVVISSYRQAGHAGLLNREYLKTRSFINSNPYPRVAADLSGRRGSPLSLLDEAGNPFGRMRTYLGPKDVFVDGVDASGTTVFSLSRIPREFARTASELYSSRLSALLAELLEAKLAGGADNTWVPQNLRQAMVLDRGRRVGNNHQ